MVTTSSPRSTTLSATHRAHLQQSGISDAIIDARGYETVRSSARLRELGFSQAQAQSLPGILIPYQDASGSTFYQYRPDKPAKGRPKYETPFGPGKYGLGLPAVGSENVLYGTGELWHTEGMKKGDAGTSAGLDMVTLMGVYMFNRDGKPLPDFDIINLENRVNVVCFDSDAMTKPEVHGALRRYAGLLRLRGAKVRFCYLPDDGEKKIGLDDFLADHTIDELRALVEDTLRPVATAPVAALINVLNRQCQGLGTFTPRRLEMAGDAGNEEAIRVLKAINGQANEIQEECDWWMGDVYNRMTFDHGDKLITLDAAIGEGNRRKIGKIASVCKAFEGDRDYFRYAAPWWFLAEIASLDPEAQDEMLTHYLTTEAAAAEAETPQSAKEQRLTREKLRAEIATKFSAGRKFQSSKITWSQLGKYLPEQVLDALYEAVQSEDAASVTHCVVNALRDWKTAKAEEEEQFRSRCEDRSLFNGELDIPQPPTSIESIGDNLTSVKPLPETTPTEPAEEERFAGDDPGAGFYDDTLSQNEEYREPEELQRLDPALLPFAPLLTALQQDALPRCPAVFSDGTKTTNLHNYVQGQLRQFQDRRQRRAALVELALCQAWFEAQITT